MPKKPELNEETGLSLPKAQAGQTLKKFPALSSYLCDPAYDETGERRLLSYLIIRPGVNYWSVTLKDPSTASQLRIQCSSWDDVLGSLEGLLTGPRTPWEHDEYAPGNGKKSTKKKS